MTQRQRWRVEAVAYAAIALVALSLVWTMKAHSQEAPACETSTIGENASTLIGAGYEFELFSGPDGAKVLATLDAMAPRPDGAEQADTVAFAYRKGADDDDEDSLGLFHGNCLVFADGIHEGTRKYIEAKALGENL